MGLFSSKMTPEQLAKAKGNGQTANQLNDLATKANGSGETRATAQKAAKDLERQVGKRKAAKLQEDALRRAGARPKGVGRFFG